MQRKEAKPGTRVTFNSKVKSGDGRVREIVDTERGPYAVIEYMAAIRVRLSQIEKFRR